MPLDQGHVPEPTEDQASAAPMPFLRITANYPDSFDTGAPDQITIDLDADAAMVEDENGDITGIVRFVVETIAALRAQRAPKMEQIVFTGDVDVKALAAMQDRIAEASRIRAERDAREAREKQYGARGLPPEVIDKVLVDENGTARRACAKCRAVGQEVTDADNVGVTGLPPDALVCADQLACVARTTSEFATGGAVLGPGSADSDEIPAGLSTCLFDQGGILPAPGDNADQPTTPVEETHPLGHPGSDRWTGGDRKDER